MQPELFYNTGGTMSRGAASYVTRPADSELCEALLRKEICYLLTSRQMGKSSLMVRAAEHMRATGYGVVMIDLTAFGKILTREQWYDSLAQRIGRHLSLEDEMEDFWFRNTTRITPFQRWFLSLSEVVLACCEKPVVIFVDEIDYCQSLPFSTDEFFAGIRRCFNRRTEDSRFERLTFCLLGVATPSDLIRDPLTTPFNIGTRIELTDFTPSEALSLMKVVTRDEALATRIIKQVVFWTGGQPYLTQCLCKHIATEQCKTIQDVDRYCEQLFFSSRSRDSDDNLAFVRNRLVKINANDRAGPLYLYLRVLKGRRVHDDDTDPRINVLRLSGVVRTMDGILRVRNEIYRRVFDKSWVSANMPGEEKRRHRAAFRKGIVASLAIMLILWVFWGFFFPKSSMAFHVAVGKKQLLEAALVYFGPGKKSCELGVVGLESLLLVDVTEIRLVEDPSPGAESLTGWEVSIADSKILIEPTGTPPREKATAFVELQWDDGLGWSRSFRLAYVHEDAWDIVGMEIDGGEGRIVAPRGQELSIALSVDDPNYIETVSVSVRGDDDEEALELLPRSIRQKRRLLYSVALTRDLRLTSGAAEIQVEVTDKANLKKSRTLSLQLESNRFEAKAWLSRDQNGQSSSVLRLQGEYLVGEWSDVILHVRPNRKARVQVNVRDELSQELLLPTPLEILPSPDGSHQIDCSFFIPTQVELGVIEVLCDENAFVCHKDKALAQRLLKLRFNRNQEVTLTYQLQTANQNTLTLDSIEAPIYLNTREAVLSVRLVTAPAPVRIKIAVDGQERGVDLLSTSMETTCDLAFEEDGEHRVRVLLFSDKENQPLVEDRPAGEREWTFVVDTEPPIVALSLEGSDVVRDVNDWPVFLLELNDLETTSLTLDWLLTRNEKPAPTSALPKELLPAKHLLKLPRVTDKSSAVVEGAYRLKVTATDTSRYASSGSLDWDVAWKPPTLALVEPSGVEWVPYEGRTWRILVRAGDENGVRSVACSFVGGTDLELPEVEMRSSGDIWTCEVELSYLWSKARVDLSVIAKDRFDLPSTLRRELRLPQIRRPERISSVFFGKMFPATQDMILVRGNNTEYIFGGRTDAVENRLFAAAGLPVFNRRRAERSWSVSFAANEIPDFYLDEHEVTNAEYLRFLGSKSGYGDEVNWSSAGKPDDTRLKNLTDRLKSEGPDLPVTQIDWEEASAYAGWAGKRLPSWIEWEYAVRNGQSYLPYASFDRVSAAQTLAIDRSGPWTMGVGDDLDEAGIWNLCTNVREWTLSPHLDDSRAASGRHDPSLKTLLMGGGSDSREPFDAFWYVGGSFASSMFDFFEIRRGRRSLRRADLGFRCALSASVMVRR